jgi:hypothetical protein
MWRDLRYAGRTLARAPGFATIAIFTLALGIGLASTIFSAVNALLIKPLPLMQNQQQLVVIEHRLKKVNEHDDVGLDYPGFLDVRKQLTTIEGISAGGAIEVIVPNDAALTVDMETSVGCVRSDLAIAPKTMD